MRNRGLRERKGDNMAKLSIAELEEILNAATSRLPKVTGKKMFGCHALWADGNVFALIWKHGRIGVKLPAEDAYASLLGVSGAEPWKAGPMKMAHWVLVPESFHGKPAEIGKWAAKAHSLCSKLAKKPAAKKTSGRKAAPKKR
jgi:TfoX/Sxy family transcriptional regulator of competence genes